MADEEPAKESPKADNAAGKSTDEIDPAASPGDKPNVLRRAFSFLSGEHDEGKPAPSEEGGNEPAFRGFWEYLRSNWSAAPAAEGEEKPPPGFLGRLRHVYSDYQTQKSEQAEKLQTYEAISLAARLSKEFLILLFGSCLIATFGLFQGSTAVIIGAMLIAPLMMPIFGFSLATVWGDRILLWRSGLTLFIGSGLVLVIATGLTLLLPGVEMNAEILARVNPNLYDILIALASGLVGAYAFVNPNISSSISGVAIAVALMPPLCTIGIALGLGDLRATFGAGLLYTTNLVGISLSASLVFWRLKIHPASASAEEVDERTKRNVTLSLVLLVLIALPLGYFMIETYSIKRAEVEAGQLLSRELPQSEVLSLEIKRYGGGAHTVRAVVVLPPELFGTDLDGVKGKLQQLLKGRAEIKLITLPMSVRKQPEPEVTPEDSEEQPGEPEEKKPKS